MSRKRLNDEVRLYTASEFESADRINRIRMFMIQPELQLNNQDWEYYLMLETIFHLCSNEMSRTVAMAKIRNKYPELSHHAIVTAYNNMNELFGNVQENNRKMQKAKLLERLSIMADKAFEKAIFMHEYEEDGETKQKEVVDADLMELTRRILRDIAEIEQYDKDKAGTEEDFKIPPLIITSDPKAFLESRKNDDDDA